jgi:hypothetical protein
MMNSGMIYYLVLYALVLIGSIVGAVLKVVPTDIVIAAFTLVFGHGSGLLSPPPGTGTPPVQPIP